MPVPRPPARYPEEIRETFEYCPACETVVVDVIRHRCAASARGGGRD